MSAVAPAADRRTLTVALAGNPNSGKTTLFNALTGLRQKVANYPGITVEKKTGRCKLPNGEWIEVIDLPGTYSLIPHSPDELVTMEVLRGLRPESPAPDVIVAVVDASNLARNLYLVGQLIELGKPVVVALNMIDIAESRGCLVNVAALAKELGVPVVPLIGHKKQGVDALLTAIPTAKPAAAHALPLPEAMWEEIHRLGKHVSAADAQSVTVRRLLAADEAADIAHLTAGPGLREHLASAKRRLETLGIDPSTAEIESRFRWIDQVVERVRVFSHKPARAHISDRIDAALMHRFWGLIIFFGIMAALFVSIFTLAQPIMDGLSDGIAWLGGVITAGMAEGPLKDLINDGIFAGVGGVVVFVPQIALLFLFLAALEDSGYLARAAFIMDRILAKVGLHGKSFIPLLSSFACAIPGIMAARTIDGKRERLATILVAPFMSCSARLPVYGLLIGAFFSQYGAFTQGVIMLGCYLLGVVAAAGTAWAFKLAARREASSAFILEMPTYKMPQASQVLMQVWTNTTKFLTKAGTTIFCLSILLWALAYYPRLPAERVAAIEGRALNVGGGIPSAPADAATILSRADKIEPRQSPGVDPKGRRGAAPEIKQAQLEYSMAGRVGKIIEPAISPIGYDWKMGVGLIGAFAAREVFNSYLGIIYSVGDDEDTTSLQEAIITDRKVDGTPVWTPLVATSLLIWFVIAMQCMSTFAVVKRETAGWKWPIIQLVYMNALAYVLCLIVYQVGLRFGL